MKTIIIIPSRMSSTRFPDKPMALINGIPMIQRVWQQAKFSNIDKAKHNATLLTMIMIYILEDPVIRENIKQVALALNDSALKPFLAVALITLKEMKPAIDEAEADLIERMKEGLRRAGDGATDAIENVISYMYGAGGESQSGDKIYE